MLIYTFVHLLNGKMHSNLICDRKKGSRSVEFFLSIDSFKLIYSCSIVDGNS